MAEEPRQQPRPFERPPSTSRDAGVRPGWVDAVSAAMMGVAGAVVITREVWGYVVAAACLVVFAALSLRFTPRRGRLSDDRAVVRQMGVFFACHAVVFVSTQIALSLTPTLVVQVVLGVVIAAAVFVMLRLDERYQSRRLREGDHGPYDII